MTPSRKRGASGTNWAQKSDKSPWRRCAGMTTPRLAGDRGKADAVWRFDGLEHETRLLETVTERYKVEKLLMIRVESKMLVGRPLVFLYDAAEGHRLSDYRELARALHDVMGHPVCLLNRARIIDDMDEGWIRQLDLASYLSQVIVPTEAGDDTGGQSK